MLSSNSLLRQGRYRVSQLAASSGSQTIYEAHDNLVAQTVLVSERSAASTFGSGIMPRHDGLLQIADRFDENGNNYLVTEALQGSGPWQLRNAQRSSGETEAVLGRFRAVIEALAMVRKHFPSIAELEITPLQMRATKDGVLRYAFFESAAAKTAKSSESPYRAIESVWDSLDLASQKAITSNYDEAALEDAEAEADERSDMYSVAAVFYQILTLRTPPSALERSIELLDSGKDPLQRPDALNPEIPAAYAEALVKMMGLRRPDRFASLNAAAAAFPHVGSRPAPAAPAAPVANKVFELDEDLDLLEIPTPAAAMHTSAAPVAVVDETHSTVAEDLSPVFDRSEEVTEEHPEPFITEPEPVSIDPVVDPAPVVEKAVTPEPVVEKLVEPKVEHAQPVFQPRSFTLSDEKTFSVEEEPKGGSGKMIGIAAGAVVVIAVAVFGILSFSSSGKSPAKPETTVAAPISQPASEPVAASEQPSAEQPETSSPASAFQPSGEKPADPAAKKDRPQVAEVKPAKPEQKPAANTAPAAAKPKKSMTVDDLINDN